MSGILYGRSLNLAEFLRQLQLRRIYRARFFGVVLGQFHVGLTFYQKSESH